MKKILFICHSIGGGAGVVLGTLVNQLAEKYDIDIIERLETNSVVIHYPANVRHLKSMSTVRSSKLWRVLLSIAIYFSPKIVYRYYIKGKYDYEISFNYLYSSYLVGHSPNKRSKKLMWIHGDLYDIDPRKCKYGKLKTRFLYSMQSQAFRRADRIVAISNLTRQSIFDLFPNEQSKVALIYNGYDFDVIDKKSCETTVPETDKFRVISMGRLEPGKNVILQIDAVKLLLDSGIDIELYILGDGDQAGHLKNAADGYVDIHFLGWQRNPYPFLLSSDLLLVTSFSEGFPTTIVEALHMGIPVVSTPVAGTSELIVEGENGYIIDYTAESAATGITKVRSSTFDRRAVSGSVDRYTNTNWGRNVIGMLESLIQ